MDTTNVDNWMEIVFICEKNETESLLKKIFGDIEKYELGLIPNYTIRKHNNTINTLNLKLYKNEKENKIKEILNNHISNLTHSFNYGDNNCLDLFYTWKNPGGEKNMAVWTENNARYLHELCKFVLKTEKPDDYYSEKYGVTWGHYLHNMMPIKFRDYKEIIS